MSGSVDRAVATGSQTAPMPKERVGAMGIGETSASCKSMADILQCALTHSFVLGRKRWSRIWAWSRKAEELGSRSSRSLRSARATKSASCRHVRPPSVRATLTTSAAMFSISAAQKRCDSMIALSELRKTDNAFVRSHFNTVGASRSTRMLPQTRWQIMLCMSTWIVRRRSRSR